MFIVGTDEKVNFHNVQDGLGSALDGSGANDSCPIIIPQITCVEWDPFISLAYGIELVSSLFPKGIKQYLLIFVDMLNHRINRSYCAIGST